MGEAEGVGPVEMATHCAEHATAIEAARARSVFACGLTNAIFSKHRVYLLAANVRAQRLPRLVPAGIPRGASTPVRVVFNGGGIQTGVTVAVPHGVVGRPARRRASRRWRHHAWSLGQRRWRLFPCVAATASGSWGSIVAHSLHESHPVGSVHCGGSVRGSRRYHHFDGYATPSLVQHGQGDGFSRPGLPSFSHVRGVIPP